MGMSYIKSIINLLIALIIVKNGQCEETVVWANTSSFAYSYLCQVPLREDPNDYYKSVETIPGYRCQLQSVRKVVENDETAEYDIRYACTANFRRPLFFGQPSCYRMTEAQKEAAACDPDVADKPCECCTNRFPERHLCWYKRVALSRAFSQCQQHFPTGIKEAPTPSFNPIYTPAGSNLDSAYWENFADIGEQEKVWEYTRPTQNVLHHKSGTPYCPTALEMRYYPECIENRLILIPKGACLQKLVLDKVPQSRSTEEDVRVKPSNENHPEYGHIPRNWDEAIVMSENTFASYSSALNDCVRIIDPFWIEAVPQYCGFCQVRSQRILKNHQPPQLGPSDT